MISLLRSALWKLRALNLWALRAELFAVRTALDGAKAELDGAKAEIAALRETTAMHARQIADFTERETALHDRVWDETAARARAMLALVEAKAMEAIQDARREILLRPALAPPPQRDPPRLASPALWAHSRAWEPCRSIADIEWPILHEVAKTTPRRRLIVFGPGLWRETLPFDAIDLAPLLIGCHGQPGFFLPAERAEGNPLATLAALPEGVAAAAVVRFLPDYLSPAEWPALFMGLSHALRASAPLILSHAALETETEAAERWMKVFWRDPAAMRPLPAATRDALLVEAGFRREAEFQVIGAGGLPVAVVVARKRESENVEERH